MSRSQIEWGEPKPWGFKGTAIEGRLGGLLVAQAVERRDGTWSAVVYLSPLPDSLDRLLDTDKASERAAKATAQRVVNAFVKILTGET